MSQKLDLTDEDISMVSVKSGDDSVENLWPRANATDDDEEMENY